MNNNNLPSYSYYGNGRPRPSHRPPKKHKHRVTTVLIILVVVGVALFLFNYGYTSKGSSPYQKVTKSLTLTKSNGPTTAQISEMGDSINQVITQNPAIDFEVAITDLNTGQQENYGQDQPMTAASVGKLVTATDFLTEVEQGKQSLSEDIDGDTAQDSLQQMIVISNDTDWENLNNTLGYPQLQDYGVSIGMSDYQSYANTFTARDTANLLSQLYNGKLLNKLDTNLLMSYMKQANYREYIVPAIPSQDTIYHKIGLYDDNVNDAAIVTYGSKAFVLVIFTNGNGTYEWNQRAIMMQTITKAALKAYFNQT